MGNTLAWEKGRQLKTFGNNAYKYNNDGIRIQKTTKTEIHEYILDGTNIVKEVVTDTANCPKYVNEYLYDLDGTVCGLKHEGIAYYFYKNLQGDIIAITDDTGATVARYTYDAWGKCTIVSDASGINIATVNPFRYRSYYYDTETKLYYLQSRYYNPEVGRFINADDVMFAINEGVIDPNLFAYCSNDVINSMDITGSLSFNSIKNKILEFIGKIKKKIQEISNKLRIYYSTNSISLPTTPLAIGIDAIIFAFSKLTHFTIKTVCKALMAWAKSNTKNFAKFIRQYLIENCKQIIISLITFLCRKFAQKYAIEKAKNRIANAVFGDCLLYRIYSAFSSLGSIVATIVDIMDGQWDDTMRIKYA